MSACVHSVCVWKREKKSSCVCVICKPVSLIAFPFLLVVYFSFNFMHQLNYPLKKVKLNIKQDRGQTLGCVAREQRRAESTARETARKWCNRNRAPECQPDNVIESLSLVPCPSLYLPCVFGEPSRHSLLLRLSSEFAACWYVSWLLAVWAVVWAVVWACVPAGSYCHQHFL